MDTRNIQNQALIIGLNFANMIVPEIAVLTGLSLSDRKQEAMRFVNAQLTANGFDLDAQTISWLVEKAYQAYKVAGGDNHAPVVTSAPTEVMAPAEGTDSND